MIKIMIKCMNKLQQRVELGAEPCWESWQCGWKAGHTAAGLVTLDKGNGREFYGKYQVTFILSPHHKQCFLRVFCQGDLTVSAKRQNPFLIKSRKLQKPEMRIHLPGMNMNDLEA